MSKKMHCSKCKELLILETRTDGDMIFGRRKCKNCNFKESWREMIIRDIIKNERAS